MLRGGGLCKSTLVCPHVALRAACHGTVVSVKNAHCNAGHATGTFRSYRERVWYFYAASSQLGMNGCGNRIGFYSGEAYLYS
jgi:hypothetical protein